MTTVVMENGLISDRKDADVVIDGKAFVEEEAANGAAYIKIIAEDRPMMAKTRIPQDVMNVIAEETHKRGLLLATHAVSVPTLQMAIDAGTNVYIHVPLEADMTPEMAAQIAAQGASCVPTLAMMKGFADIPIYGYKKEDYKHSENNARMLHEAGVPLLVGTDASNLIFLPWVKFGRVLHKEMQLMAGAGLKPEEILAGATGLTAKAYGETGVGTLEPGRRAEKLNAAKEKHPELITRVCDISDEQERKDLFTWVTAEYPEINVLLTSGQVQHLAHLAPHCIKRRSQRHNSYPNGSNRIHSGSCFSLIFLEMLLLRKRPHSGR